MTQPTDSSVMFALDELRKLESERQAEQKRREEESAQVRIRAEAERREQQEHARRVAEAEARMRVEQELRARDVEAEQRLRMLRAELSAVRADRERIHATVSRLNDEVEVPPRRRVSPWALAFGASALVAVGLAFVLLARPPVTTDHIVQVPVQTAESATPVAGTPEDPTVTGEPDPTEQAAAAPTEPDATDPSVDTAQATQPRPGRPDRDTTVAVRPAGSDRPGMHGAETMDTALDFEHCGADPTCGLDL